MRIVFATFLAALIAAPLAAQEEATEAPDYTRERLRSIFLQAAEEGQEAAEDPFKMGVQLFDFTIGGTRTTVRFLLPSGLIPGETGVQLFPVIDPFLMTATPGTPMAPRLRNRYSEWWVNRKLGFPIAPPKN